MIPNYTRTKHGCSGTTQNGKKLFIKKAKISSNVDQTRTENEIRILQRFGEDAPELYGHIPSTEKDAEYLVMEGMDCDFKQFMKENKHTPKNVKEILFQIFLIFRKHNQDGSYFLHKDFHFENVCLKQNNKKKKIETKNGEITFGFEPDYLVKLIDFQDSEFEQKQESFDCTQDIAPISNEICSIQGLESNEQQEDSFTQFKKDLEIGLTFSGALNHKYFMALRKTQTTNAAHDENETKNEIDVRVFESAAIVLRGEILKKPQQERKKCCQWIVKQILGKDDDEELINQFKKGRPIDQRNALVRLLKQKSTKIPQKSQENSLQSSSKQEDPPKNQN